MELKKIFLFFAILAAIFIPWYKKYIPYFNREKCDQSKSLIDLKKLKNINNINICNYDDLKNLVKIVSSYDKNLKLINTLTFEQQFDIYKNIIDSYVIDAYAVEKYLQDNNIMRDNNFSKDKKIYLKIMENNFNIEFFKKCIAENIKIEDVFAEEYYNKYKLKEFTRYPFVKESPIINARIIKINDSKKDNQFYQDLLQKGTQDCVFLDNYNPYNNESILSVTLLNMKEGEFTILKLDNDQKFMLYKINEILPVWYSYNDVSQNVKSYLQEKLINEEASRIINQIKLNCDINVCDEKLSQYIKENSINNSNLHDLTDGEDMIDDDFVESGEVKYLI